MENNNAPATTARQCLTQCNILSTCQFWDFGNGYCRLRSNEGQGPEVAKWYLGGAKHCTSTGTCISHTF